MRTDAVLDRRTDLLPAALLRLASDQRLVEHVGAGSERAFEVLFDRHHRAVLAFCRHMLGSREEAEDVVQLTFLAAYRDLGRNARPTALRPWLYAIARHRCLSALRARRERPVEEVSVPATDHLAAEVTTREDLRTLLDDVAHLPDDQRAALVLAELGDVSHDEIARILDCPREKVKALVFQARSSLLASRVARDTPCAEIREQLATLRGGALRRTTVHRHLRACPACSAFREQIRVQRRALRILLPVAPGLGLKRAVLGAIVDSGVGAGGTALTATALSSGGLAAALVLLAIPGGGIRAVASAHPDRDRASHVTPAAKAAMANAWPGPTARPARLKAGRQMSGRVSTASRPSAVPATRDPQDAHRPPPPHGASHGEAARPQPAAGFTPAAADGSAAPAPVAAAGPPPSDSRPARAKPPPSDGRPSSRTPGKPSQAPGRRPPAPPGKSGAPPWSGGRPPVAVAAGPSTPSQAAPGPTTPRGPGGPPAAAGDGGPGGASGPPAPPAAAGPPSGSATSAHGAAGADAGAPGPRPR